MMARLKFTVGLSLAFTLIGIVFVVLYSLIFVTQPLNAISPIDQKFFELIVPIATFLTGTLSGIMLAGGDKDAQREALKAANKGWERPPTPPAPSTPSPSPSSSRSFSSGPTEQREPHFDQGLAVVGEVVAGFGGKPAPVQPPQPLL